MKRISREDLRMHIRIALIVRKPYEKRDLGLKTSAAVDTVTDDLVNRIMGRPESETIMIVADQIGTTLTPRPGLWDVDEPHPHPEVPWRAHVPPRRIDDD